MAGLSSAHYALTPMRRMPVLGWVGGQASADDGERLPRLEVHWSRPCRTVECVGLLQLFGSEIEMLACGSHIRSIALDRLRSLMNGLVTP